MDKRQEQAFDAIDRAVESVAPLIAMRRALVDGGWCGHCAEQVVIEIVRAQGR